MANPGKCRLRARFFVSPSGVVVEKARALTTRERRAIFARDGAHCRYCGRRVSFTRPYGWPYQGDAPGHVDHVFPRARGGQNDPSNLALACQRCNESKGASC